MEKISLTKGLIGIYNFDHAFYMVIKDFENTSELSEEAKISGFIITWNNRDEDE